MSDGEHTNLCTFCRAEYRRAEQIEIITVFRGKVATITIKPFEERTPICITCIKMQLIGALEGGDRR